MAAPGSIAMRHRFARRELSAGFPQRDTRARPGTNLMRRKPDAASAATPNREPQPPAKRVDPRPPRVGFVSLGCPKALVDSELILTQLRAEGYAISPTYAGADLVVLNTCGFIDAAVAE